MIYKGSVSMYNEDKKKKKKTKSREETLFHRFFHKRTKRLLTNIDRLFSKIMWYQIASCVFLILLGVLFLLVPDISDQVLGILFGMNVLFFGGVNIYAYLKRRDIPLFQFHLVYGIIGILIGILTILNPFLFAQVITLFLGLWILYMAITKIDFSMRLKKMGEKSWLLLLVSSILEIFMSILIFINPFSSLVLTRLCGAYFVLCGIINCNDAILTKNRAIDFLENL